jgi:hypothetical protein
MIKAQKKLEIEGKYSTKMKSAYGTLYQMGKTEAISSKIKKDTRISTLFTLIQYSALNSYPDQKSKRKKSNGYK